MNKRELVIVLISQGKTTKEICQATGLTESGVRYHSSCVKCDYNTCPDAMVFHHLDPNQKDFKIGSGRTWGWERLKKELDKTILLCNRCHTELHAGLWQL